MGVVGRSRNVLTRVISDRGRYGGDARPKPTRQGKTRPLSCCEPSAKTRLLTREHLDGRTVAARHFDQLAANICADLGGKDQLSAIELTLVEAYAGAGTILNDLNTRLLLGEKVDLEKHSQTISAMVRIATRLGTKRRAKDVTPNLQTYLRMREHAEAEESRKPRNHL